MNITGGIIVQDGMPDVLRAIESLATFCNKIYIVDGGSKDGTGSFIHDRAAIYNVELFTRPFDNGIAQRNFLLDKMPKDTWIATLDHDEKFSHNLERNITKYLEQVPYHLYERPGKTPLTLSLKFFNLTQDIHHYIGEPYYHQQRIFYNDEGLKWHSATTADPEHPILSYEDTEFMSTIQPVKGFGVLHYADLDPRRKEWRKKQKGTKLDSYYQNLIWDDTSVYPLPDEYR